MLNHHGFQTCRIDCVYASVNLFYYGYDFMMFCSNTQSVSRKKKFRRGFLYDLRDLQRNVVQLPRDVSEEPILVQAQDAACEESNAYLKGCGAFDLFRHVGILFHIVDKRPAHLSENGG